MHEGRSYALLNSLELILHLPPELQVEGAQRFVQKQDLGLHHQGAGKRHALPLTARELMRPLSRRLIEADETQNIQRAGMALRPLHLSHAEAESHVGQH